MWQYLYMLPWPVLVTGVGVLNFAYGFSVQPPDWGSRLPWAAGIAAIGLVWAGYVLGMRVDVDEENVTKVYLFGLLRERIPRDALTFDVDESRDRYGWSIERYQFMNERGPGYFGLYSGWCWRSGDVEYLYNISKGKRDWNFGVHRQNRRLVQAIVVLPIAAIVVLVVVAKMASPG